MQYVKHVRFGDGASQRIQLTMADARQPGVYLAVDIRALSGDEPYQAFTGIPGVQPWHWPTSQRTEPGAKMHAKLAVADRRVLLVTSANLTQAGYRVIPAFGDGKSKPRPGGAGYGGGRIIGGRVFPSILHQANAKVQCPRRSRPRRHGQLWPDRIQGASTMRQPSLACRAIAVTTSLGACRACPGQRDD